MATVELCEATQCYSAGRRAVDDVSLRVDDGELLVVAGPSGSGKSTLLRLVAGLERPSTGRILLGERDVTRWAPHRRNVSMVFQHDALLPHLTVQRNLEFGSQLRLRGGISVQRLRHWINPAKAAVQQAAASEIGNRVRQAAELLGITSLLRRRPQELSGGERQRVALGRAMVRDPAAFLFDEPLSSLDAEHRRQLSDALRDWHRRRGVTTLWVTHDQAEALAVADRIAVMHRGRLQQVATPSALYWQPTNLMVARFIGTAPINVVGGYWQPDGERSVLVDDGGRRWSFAGEPSRGQTPGADGARVILAFRPEDVRQQPDPPGLVLPTAAVTQVGWRGDHALVGLAPVEGAPALWRVRCEGTPPAMGETRHWSVPAARCLWFDAATEKRMGI